MADSLSAAFRGQPARETPIAISTSTGLPSTNVIALPAPPVSGESPIARSQDSPRAPGLSEIGDDIARAMAPLVLKDEIVIRKHEDWLEVEIRNDVLFPSGSATLTPQARDIVRELGQTLAGVPNPIFVEGHTDNVPIAREVFPSNWELSTARASAVIRLLSSGGVSPTQMTALGFGEYRPTQANDTPAGRAANRRVMLAILAPERIGQNLYSQAGMSSGGTNAAGAGAPSNFTLVRPDGAPAIPKAPPP